MLMLTKKCRSDATWNKLTTAQRETVDEWLFDERLAYAEIVARAEKEFGLKASVASLSRYYQRRATDRQGWELLEAREMAEQVNGLAGNTDDILRAVVNLTGKAALRAGIERPDQLDTLVSLAKVLLDREKNDLRRERLGQIDRQFNHEAALAGLKEMPQFRAFLRSIEDDAKLGARRRPGASRNFCLIGNSRRKSGNGRKKRHARRPGKSRRPDRSTRRK